MGCGTSRLGGVLIASIETLPVGGELEDDAVVDVLLATGLSAQMVGCSQKRNAIGQKNAKLM
jgi:hypothetical protein